MIEPVPVLAGNVTTLRPYYLGFSESELEALYRWGRDADLLALSGGSLLEMPFPQFRSLFLDQLPKRNGAAEELFAILDGDMRMVGRIGLFGLGGQADSAELGIVIGERPAWGHGLGQDAIRTLCAFAFSQAGLRRIFLYTFLDNLRAQRAFTATGFRPVRQLKRFSFERGLRDELEMELLTPLR